MLLLMMSTLAHAGDLDITVIDGDEELSASLSGLAPCRAHELRLEGEEGTWTLRLRAQDQDGDVLIDADVQRWAGPRELHLAPSLLLNPGEEGSIAVDDVELIVVASGFEGQGCSQTVQRSRTRTTRRTSE
jgi:hypothetical protein